MSEFRVLYCILVNTMSHHDNCLTSPLSLRLYLARMTETFNRLNLAKDTTH